MSAFGVYGHVCVSVGVVRHHQMTVVEHGTSFEALNNNIMFMVYKGERLRGI